jgi:hypothetical protein
MTQPGESIEAGVDRFAVLLGEHSQLREELGSSGREFFGGEPPRHDPAEALLAARRHLEWFLFERHSPSLFGSPAEHLLDAWLDEAPPDLGERGEVLLRSFVGIFEVLELLPGVGCWLRDVAGFGNYALAYPTDNGLLRLEDLLVGRLFPVEDGLHRASSAAAVFRAGHLNKALERDLEQIRSKSQRKVLRLSQQGLEKMFWGAGHRPRSQDPVGDLRAFLGQQPHLAGHRVESILSLLTWAPFDPDKLAHGAGGPLGAILDDLAFDTDIDLEATRRHLLLAWQELTRDRTPAADQTPSAAHEAPDSEGPSQAMARFDSGRRAGHDLDGLFQDLEQELGLEEVSGEEDEKDSPAPDFPGVVGAMIAEYRWEVENGQDGAAPAYLDSLGLLAQFAQPIGVFEELGSRDLLRFVSFWVHEHQALDSAQEARNLLHALTSFCTWVQESHEHPLLDQFGSTLERLHESLPRIVELNRALPDNGGSAEDPRGKLFEVCTDARGQLDHLRDRDGETHQVQIEPALATRLRHGDRIHGWLDLQGNLTIRRCYPPEAAGLMPDVGA